MPARDEVTVVIVDRRQVPTSGHQLIGRRPTDALQWKAIEVLPGPELLGEVAYVLRDIVGRDPQPISEGAEAEPGESITQAIPQVPSSD